MTSSKGNVARQATRSVETAAIAFVIALIALTLAPRLATAAEPLPAWWVDGSTYPTKFEPGATGTDQQGPGFHLQISNVGAGDAGAFVVSDTLPSALVPVPGVSGRYGSDAEYFSCSIAGQTVTCEGTGLAAGDSAFINLPVEVAADAAGEYVNEVTVTGGGAPGSSTDIPVEIGDAAVPFGFSPGFGGLHAVSTLPNGSAAVQAGSHPFQTMIGIGLRTSVSSDRITASGGGLKDLSVTLPKGMVVNPEATPVKCTEAQLEQRASAFSQSLSHCPPASQIGNIYLALAVGEGGVAGAEVHPLYNMVPLPGTPATFGFEANAGVYVHLLGKVRADGEYELAASANDLLAKLGVQRSDAILWGNPTDPLHDSGRPPCLDGSERHCVPLTRTSTSLLTMPSSCTGTIAVNASIGGWFEPDKSVSQSVAMTDNEGNPVGIEGCSSVEFDPSISAKPTTNVSDSPSGLEFNLHQPQNLDYEGQSTANLKDVRVSLPSGLTLNPSAANGLLACTEDEIGYQPDGDKVRFSESPQRCPDAAKIGTVSVSTPLLDHPLPGAVYVAKPLDNPFGSLLAIYLAVEDERSGVVAKLAGKVDPDAETGQLTARFTENPELPLEDIDLSLFKGSTGVLTTPVSCGTHVTTSDLTPWSSPEGVDAHPSDSFEVSTPPPGVGPCPSSAENLPDLVNFTAGTMAPEAGAFSPLLVRISRPDGSQRITAIDTTLPPGLTGKLAGVPYCPDAAIAAAASRSNPNDGAAELASPSCPLASQVGTVEVGAGSGPTPVSVSGHAYLAGPYKGAPISLAVITPAVAGPFDLGNVVTRVALYVDPETAKIHAVSDPLPTILHGISLDVRSIALKMDRQGFTLNPTSCDPMAVAAAVTSSVGHQSMLTSPFQVGSCSTLAFKPKLWLKLKGGTKRSKYPALTAIVTQPPGQANIGKVSVTLPHSAFLEQAHIGTVCTRVQFAEGAVPGEKCPKRSVYGKAKAFTPLLDKPVSGPVFLRSSSHELPDLVAALHGQVDVVVVGRVDSVKGRLRNTFEAVPDAPVSKFVLQMQGGKRGLVVNSTDLCRTKQRATLKMRGQNGKEFQARPLVRNSCKAKRGKRKR